LPMTIQSIDDLYHARNSKRASEALWLAQAIKPLLASQPASVHGAALAELVAAYLRDFQVANDADETAILRLRLLVHMMDTALDLAAFED